jgi:hypothetical protein
MRCDGKQQIDLQSCGLYLSPDFFEVKGRIVRLCIDEGLQQVNRSPPLKTRPDPPRQVVGSHDISRPRIRERLVGRILLVKTPLLLAFSVTLRFSVSWHGHCDRTTP